jgi:AcrR family transcriptional regulator
VTPTAATEKDPVRKKILAAMDRLLDGKPLRSTGRLSVSQLAAEAGLGRWHLTHQHTDLKELFQARVKDAQTAAAAAGPSAYDKLKAEHAELRAHCAELEQQLQLYASVINLLTLEKESANSKSTVAALEHRRTRRSSQDVIGPC